MPCDTTGSPSWPKREEDRRPKNRRAYHSWKQKEGPSCPLLRIRQLGTCTAQDSPSTFSPTSCHSVDMSPPSATQCHIGQSCTSVPPAVIGAKTTKFVLLSIERRNCNGNILEYCCSLRKAAAAATAASSVYRSFLT